MNNLPLTINRNSHSMARLNVNGSVFVLANAINRSLSRNVFQQQDFLMSLPNSADLDSALTLNCNLCFSLSCANVDVESAPFRVFTRDLTAVKLIYDSFNKLWVDWQKERKDGDLLVNGYVKQNTIEKIDDPSQIVLNYLVDPIAPIHASIKLESLLELTKKHGIVISDHYTIPIVSCIICLFDPSYRGCPLHMFDLEYGLQHVKCVKHEKQLNYHLVSLNLKYPKRPTEIDDEYINESTGNDESSHNMSSDEDINDNSNSQSVN